LITVAGPPLAIKHRYSFNESANATTVEDSVGDADGVIKGEARRSMAAPALTARRHRVGRGSRVGAWICPTGSSARS
jgi:hypothetical protein